MTPGVQDLDITTTERAISNLSTPKHTVFEIKRVTTARRHLLFGTEVADRRDMRYGDELLGPGVLSCVCALQLAAWG